MRAVGRRTLGDVLIDRDDADVGQHGFTGNEMFGLPGVLWKFLRQDDVDTIAWRNQAGDAADGIDGNGNRAGTGRQHCGEEPALMRPHDVGLGDGAPVSMYLRISELRRSARASGVSMMASGGTLSAGALRGEKSSMRASVPGGRGRAATR